MLLVLVVAVVVLGVRVGWARASSQPQPVAPAAHGPPEGLVSRSVPPAFSTTTTAAPGPSPSAPSVLVVDVVGQVRRPGVVRLPLGSRVIDAVTAAGGQTPSADLTLVNLARPVVDGEQILVPKPGDVVPAGGPGGTGGPLGAAGRAGASGGTGSGGIGGAGAGGSAGLVDLNTADAAALDSLPGVGPVLAQRILDWRAQHGRFSSVDELGEVSGIGDKLMAQLAPKVTV